MKTFNVFSLVMLLGLILANFVWKEKQSNIGYQTFSYDRFSIADKNGNVSFNWAALISPTQNEARKIESDTIRFSEMIYLPKAKKYILVDPLYGNMGERLFVNKIKQVFSDTLKQTNINNRFSLDGQSDGVRRNKMPSDYLKKMKLDSLNVFATASPDAANYGFAKSMMPGHYERENLNLAFDRLNRSVQILEELGYRATSLKFTELQFPDKASVLQAIANPSILIKMRFVKLSGVMSIQKLDIKTLSLPVLLPIWLWFCGLVFSLIIKIRSTLRTQKNLEPNKSNNLLVSHEIFKCLEILMGAIIIFIGSTAIIIFLGIYYLFGLIIVFLIYLLWFYRITIKESGKEFSNWLSWDMSQIKYWWRSKSRLQRVLYFIGLYALVVTAVVLRYLWTQKFP